MGKRRQVIDTVFAGIDDPLSHVVYNVKGVATSPNGVLSAPRGTFFVMNSSGTAASDDDVYLNNSTTSPGTTWTLIYDASSVGHLYV